VIGIIVSGHGHFATGITSSLELIMGKQDCYTTIDFPFGSSKVELEQMFASAVADMKDCEDIMILTDLFSGSPFNVAMEKAAADARIHLYYGINLGMLIEIVSRRMFRGSYAEVADGILDVGRQQIGLFSVEQLKEKAADNDEEEL
jgi:N-acetylgalactosamine PTS system EIIA component